MYINHSSVKPRGKVDAPPRSIFGFALFHASMQWDLLMPIPIDQSATLNPISTSKRDLLANRNRWQLKVQTFKPVLNVKMIIVEIIRRLHCCLKTLLSTRLHLSVWLTSSDFPLTSFDFTNTYTNPGTPCLPQGVSFFTFQRQNFS